MPGGDASPWPAGRARWRITTYGAALLLAYAVGMVLAWLLGRWPTDAAGQGVASDHVVFWAAGRLVLAGQAAAAYDWPVHHAMQARALAEPLSGFLPFLHPPPFLLLVTPFALLPYPLSWLAWLLATGALWAAVLWRIAPSPLAALLLAAPATLVNLNYGQTGFLVAALLGATLFWLDRRPLLAGLALGLLTLKPQFGLLFPLLLALDGRWRVFAAATATSLALALAATLLFGPGIWGAFLASAMEPARLLPSAAADAETIKQQSLHAALRLAGLSPGFALALHGAAGLLLLLLVLRFWRGAAPAGSRAAAVLVAALLLSPYAYGYDAVALSAAAAFLLRDAPRHGLPAPDALLLGLALLLPAAAGALPALAVPLAGLLLLLLAWRMAGRAAGAGSPPRPSAITAM